MTADIANYAFAYVLIGAVIWALLVSGGLMEKAFQHSRTTSVLVSLGSIFGWPILVCVFVSAMAQGYRQRRAR